MRAILFIMILIVVGLLVAVATGFLDISQTRSAEPPQISATGNGVTARAGQTPAFDIETGSVAVGARPANVRVPTIEVKPPSANNLGAVNAAAGNGVQNAG